MKRSLLGTLLISAAMGMGPQVQAATLVNQWSFEGSAKDTSGNGNNGTISGGPVYVPGKFGQGIYLNRFDQIANTAASGLPVAGGASWSCNVWLYLTNAPDMLAYFAGFGYASSSAPGGTTRALIAFGASDNLGIYSWGDNADLASGVDFPQNQWIMVTITHDGVSGTRTIWLNGTSIASGVSGLNNAPSAVQVGGAAWAGHGFQGILDEFTVWSGVLQASDIASLFASNSLPNLAPSIATSPASASGYAGEYLALRVTASGSGPFTYQWLQASTNVPGATNATLVLGPLSTNSAGNYAVIVANAVGSVTSAPPATVTVLPVPNIATALAAYWPFDETNGTTVADATGNGNDGTMFNFVGDGSERVPGKLGRALHFRGAGTGLNDYVRVASNNILPGTTMTVAAWVWVDSITYWGTILKNWPNTGGNDQIHLGTQSTDADLSCYLSSPGGVASGPAREGVGNFLPLGQWVHVAVVCNGQTMQLYRNGAPSGSAVAYNGQINTNTLANNLGIGARLNAGVPDGSTPGYWHGSLDDMGVWARGLTPGEILAIYMAGQAGQPLTNADAYTGQTLPLIASQPQDVTRFQGEHGAQFTVEAAGQGALSYQWLANGLGVPAGTNNVLNLSGPLTNSASYTVAITDAGNGHSITSAPALLNILPVTAITNALVGYWKFDETNGTTAADSTPSGRTATLFNFPGDSTTWVPGQIGGALAFAGSASSQVVGIPDLVLATNNTLTVSAWVWANAEDDSASIVDCYGQNPVGQFRFGLAGGSGSQPLRGGVIPQGQGFAYTQEGANFPTGSWQHVALVVDGASVRLYRNGSLTASSAFNGTVQSKPWVTNILVGARIADDGISLNSTPGFWNGLMDDLGMWSRGLTADEILGIYAAGVNHQPLTAASSTGVKPLISSGPTSLTVTEGDDVNFTVSATGAAPLRYQWWKNGAIIAGATTTILSLPSAVLSDAANYTVVVSNIIGSVTSTPAATLTVNPLAPLPPMTSDMVAWWKFDDGAGTNALDSVGGLNGQLLDYPNNNSQWVGGVVGDTLTFNGNGECVYVPDYPKPTTNMTVAAWVWADAAAAWGTVLKNWSDSYAGQFHFGLNSGGANLDLYVQESGGSVVHTSDGATFPLGSWQHVAFVCDGILVRLYRNGIQVGSVAYDGTLQPTPPISCLGIGAKMNDTCTGHSSSTGNEGYWKGKIDDMGLWARGLSPVEIQALYSSGLGGRNIGSASLAPTLQVRHSGASAVFSWPEAPLGRGFVLESTPGLQPSSWAPAGGTLTVANGQCSVTLPISSVQSTFFRLHQ